MENISYLEKQIIQKNPIAGVFFCLGINPNDLPCLDLIEDKYKKQETIHTEERSFMPNINKQQKLSSEVFTNFSVFTHLDYLFL